MRHFQKIIFLFLFILSGLTSVKSWAQGCTPTIAKVINNSVAFGSGSAASVWNNASDLITGSSPKQVCVSTCTTGTCQEYVVGVNRSTCTFSSYTESFSALGGITKIGATFTNSNLPGILFQKFASSTGILCKGRMTYSLTGPALTGGDPCAAYGQPTYSTTFDIFKNVTSYPSMVTPTCVAAADKFALTVDPMLQCAADGIGVDDISWTTTGLVNIYTGVANAYNSSDKTAYTFQVGNDFPACSTGTGTTCVPYGAPNLVSFPITVTASIGRCANYVVSTNIYRKSKNTYLTSQTYSGINYCSILHDITPSGFSNGAVIPICTTANCTGSFYLISQGNKGVSGMSYSFDGAAGYTLLDGATLATLVNPTTSNSVKVVSISGQQNGAVFNVLETNVNGGCNTVGAPFYVFRSLVSGYNTITVVGSPQLGQSCYMNGETLTATLNNPAGNTRYHWSVPTNWEITGHNGTAGSFTNSNTVLEANNATQITVKALLNASLGRIRVNNMVTEPDIKAVNPACEVEILTSSDVGGASEAGLPNTFTYNSGTTPRQVQSSITAAAVENLDGPSPNNNCESTDLDFIYTFAGRVYNCDPNTGGCTTPVYTTPGSGTTFECNTSIFNSNAYCSQPAGKLFAPLRTGFWYKGIFKQIVRPAANQNCSYLACYYSEETIDCSTNPTAIQGRIAVDNLAIYGGEMVDETQLGVFPNPVSSDLANIQVPKDGEGQFEIHDFTGKIMRTLNLKQGQNVLNLAQVPKGIYRLTNIRNRKVSVSFIIE